MSWIAVAVGGVTLVNGYLQREAAKDAAEAQTNAANNANAVSQSVYEQQRKDYEPWRQAGITALNGLNSPAFQKDFSMEDYKTDPGYQVRLNEGLKSVNASASARGNAQGGATMKALTRFGQDYASNEYQKAYDRYNANLNNKFNRLSSVAGLGQVSTQGMSNAAQNYGSNVSGNLMAAGNAQSASQIAGANAMSNTIGSIGNTALNYQYLNRRWPTS